MASLSSLLLRIILVLAILQAAFAATDCPAGQGSDPADPTRATCVDCISDPTKPLTYSTAVNSNTACIACIDNSADCGGDKGPGTCAAGYAGTTDPTATGGASCTACSTDTYKADAGNTACSPCAKTTTTPATLIVDQCGGTSPGECIAGYGFSASTKTCTACTSNYYKLGVSNNACVLCNMDATDCGGAKAGTCKAGYGTTNAGVNCNHCDDGVSYKTATDNSNCVLCVPNAYQCGFTSAGFCEKGFGGTTDPAATGGASCVACTTGTYKATNTNVACTACGTNAGCGGDSDGSCAAGETGNPGSCTACSAGKYKDVTGSSQCSNVGGGEYPSTTITISSPEKTWSGIAASPTYMSLVATVSGTNGAIWSSLDGGATWSAQEDATATGKGWGGIVAAVATDDDWKNGVVKMAATVSGGGIWKSDDSGKKWTTTSAPTKAWTGIAGTPDLTIMVALDYVGTPWKTINSGDTWVAINGPTDASDLWGIAISPCGRKMLVTASTSIYMTIDDAVTWTTKKTGLLEFKGITASADFTNMAVVVSNGQIWSSSDTGTTWATIGASPSKTWRYIIGTFTIVSQTNNKAFYRFAATATTNAQDGAPGDYIYQSSDAGAHWSHNGQIAGALAAAPVNQGDLGAPASTNCPPGSYSPEPASGAAQGNQICTLCEAGTYSSGLGTNDAGTDGNTACATCPTGKTSTLGAVLCTPTAAPTPAPTGSSSNAQGSSSTGGVVGGVCGGLAVLGAVGYYYFYVHTAEKTALSAADNSGLDMKLTKIDKEDNWA